MAACCLEVTAKQASFDTDVDRKWGGKQDPYIILAVGQEKRRSKTVTDGGTNPIWNEVFMFSSVTAGDHLVLDFYDENVVFSDTLLGRSRVPLKQLFGQLAPVQRIETITDVAKGKTRGTATLVLSLKPVQGAPGALAGVQPRAAARTDGFWVLPTYKNTDVAATYEKGKVLGKGTFGVTCMGTHRSTGERVAIKVIPKRQLRLRAEIQDVQNEVQTLLHLKGHPNIVQLKGVYEDRDNVSLVMELCEGGELFYAITARGSYSERDAAGLIRSIVAVVAYCHNMGVVHRDLKPENFMLSDRTSKATIKAIDFGMARFFKEGERMTDLAGSTCYMAPEVLRRRYGKEADIWSCGVILYVLLCGGLPFAGINERELNEAIERKPLDLKSGPWSRISAGAKDCVRRMLERDPSKRARAQEILQHEWMRENGCASAEDIQPEVVSRMRTFNAMNRLKKAAIQLIAQSLPHDEVNGLRELFNEIDKDGSGTINEKELRFALERKGASRAWLGDIAGLIQRADVNGDGQVDCEEFLAATISHAKLQREELLVKAFRQFDANGDGEITPQELSAALSAPPLRVDPKEIKEIIDQVDMNGDGRINYTEFAAMMRS